MRRGLHTFALPVALLAACATAEAPGPSNETDRAQIMAVEQLWLDHFADASVLEDILADDFTHPVAAGVILSKRQHIEWARAHPQRSGVALSFETLDVRLYGSIAIATGVTVRREGASIERTVFTDVFAYRDGRWRAVSAQETPIAR